MQGLIVLHDRRRSRDAIHGETTMTIGEQASCFTGLLMEGLGVRSA